MEIPQSGAGVRTIHVRGLGWRQPPESERLYARDPNSVDGRYPCCQQLAVEAPRWPDRQRHDLSARHCTRYNNRPISASACATATVTFAPRSAYLDDRFQDPHSKQSKPEQSKMTHDELKKKLINAGKVLVDNGQDDFTRGHISVRLLDDPKLFFMKPHSLGLDEITLENILTIDLEGNVVAGTSRRHSEVYIHSEIFRVRPDVQSVVHTHPPYAIA